MGKREGPPSLADVEALLRQASLDLESIVAQERRGEIWPGASGPARQRYESLARRCRQVQVGLVARRGAAPEADYLAYGRMKRKYVTALTESQAAQRDLPKAEQLVADRHQSVDRAKVNLEVCLKTDDKLAVGRAEVELAAAEKLLRMAKLDREEILTRHQEAVARAAEYQQQLAALDAALVA